jgi:hypothetical protein
MQAINSWQTRLDDAYLEKMAADAALYDIKYNRPAQSLGPRELADANQRAIKAAAAVEQAERQVMMQG